MIGTLFKQVKDVHFVGIGGVGMSGIAEIMLALGFGISGSDVRGSGMTERLKELGARIWIGHHRDHLEKADVVVFSSAVSMDNPELMAARERMIPIIPRAEMLAELMRMQTSVTVAGMHGKTTTTSMIASVLSAAGLDPTVVIGGKLDTLGSGARLGAGDLLVAEADESDRSFLKLFPTIAVVTNMDLEHLDCYSSIEEIRSVFLEYINRIPFYGYAIVCLDDPQVQNIIPHIEKRFITYGLSTQANFHARRPVFESGVTSFEVYKEHTRLGEIRLPMPGIHNLVDSLAAVTVADLFDVPFACTQEALESFPGVQRRFTVRGKADGITIIDDYGHHPTEIRAVLQAARQIAPSRIAVLFQPHRYTRTQALFQDFLTCFHDADLLYVMDIYPASEKPIEGVTGWALSQGIHSRGHKTVRFLPDRQAIPAEVAKDLKPGDMLITLGAGDVTRIGPEILEELRKREESRK
ncbi:UDP-N-acetylmuramate--L-alanine ligase [Desulfomonile tiedjei]|uniref:UDP-N-acetylmuramate--L-alanine ligase n=1 Tax=Desulfomonile tiedjei (strain ATCC 49306 / DSM 6799 / DCB-1) TaxID=706587 RepID=I4CCN9_DESTA|nr:UDP-N-acetylmuramate--L-alanine ligase [Desulfomonile tiedjei]AFM27330.1 UDP-N-acetylmuramate--L-alanine ligase [Desulfomonile tiedjei DSM 6799]